MTSFIVLNGTGLLITLVCMFLVWKLGIKIQKASVVDIFWSLIIAFIAVYFLLMAGGRGLRGFLIGSMTFIWALRLSLYILYRSKGMKLEDSRYQSLKNKWGSQAGPKMLKFYFQQGIGGLMFAWPALFVGMSRESSVGLFEVVGFLIWFVALCGETIADVQMIRFKADEQNKGKVCRQGLWAFSRHPNYFFEWLVWVGIFCFALGSPFGWVTIICPVSMYYFLNFVTGVAFTERESARTKGEPYKAYQREVNAFFPGYPKLWRRSK